MSGFDVVVPTAGRESLARLLDALGAGQGPLPGRVIVVDDRGPGAGEPLPLGGTGEVRARVQVVRGRGRGPAAARNLGRRRARANWVAFLDDDVVPRPGWRARLAADLDALPGQAAGSQGRVVVPLPVDRPASDWERNVAGLEGARWATADMAYRRSALAEVGGFDERFQRAYREDADLGLRLTGAGFELARGRRVVEHPVRPAAASVSLRLQAGNADDVLMRALHGPGWRERAGAPHGRLRRHVAITAAGLTALAALAVGRPATASGAAALWAAGSAELARARIAPGPRDAREVARMLWTSALMPPLATGWWLRGHARRRSLLRDARRAPRPDRPLAVLLDRDGTLIRDVPYNGDPNLVEPLPRAAEALERLRAARLPTAVVSNQSGVARGLVDPSQVEAVNRRVEDLLGPLGPVLWCPHGPDDGCRCRKPRAGLLIDAARRLGVPPERCALVGDIGADMEAAEAAGARGVLVPTPRTRPEELEAAPEVAADLPEAVEMLLAEPARAEEAAAA